MTRRLVVPAGLVAVAAAAGLIAAGTGSAQTPAAQTLNLFEADAGSTAAIVDNAPKSPVANPESRRYRFSMGDKIEFANPLLDRRGGTRVGTLYGEATAMRGSSFANLQMLVEVVASFNDGSQITAYGVFRPGRDATVAITGGTGPYNGARGSVTTRVGQGGSQDTFELLP